MIKISGSKCVVGIKIPSGGHGGHWILISGGVQGGCRVLGLWIGGSIVGSESAIYFKGKADEQYCPPIRPSNSSRRGQAPSAICAFVSPPSHAADLEYTDQQEPPQTPPSLRPNPWKTLYPHKEIIPRYIPPKRIKLRPPIRLHRK